MDQFKHAPRAIAGRLENIVQAGVQRDAPEVAALTTAIEHIRICQRNSAWDAAARATVLDQIKRAFQPE